MRCGPTALQLHWSDLPTKFCESLEEHADEDALVFEGIGFFDVVSLLSQSPGPALGSAYGTGCRVDRMWGVSSTLSGREVPV